MFIVDETTIILNLLELANGPQNGEPCNGGLFLVGMVASILTILGGVFSYTRANKVYAYIERYTNYRQPINKPNFIFNLVMCVIGLLITLWLAFVTYTVSTSDQYTYLRYANFRYINYVKDDPNIKPEIKELIEGYISSREATLKKLDDLEIEERLMKLNKGSKDET